MLNIVMLCCSMLAASPHKPVRQPWIGRPSTMALFQTAAVIADGITTRQMINRGFVELDPITRPLIGRQPTYGRMIPLGAAEVGLSYLLARKYPKMRWLQLSFTVTHGICALHNSRL